MRRVYADQPSTAPASKARGASDQASDAPAARNYSDDALPERQAPVTVLAPVSLWKISAMATLFLLCIAALEAVYLYSQNWVGLETQDLSAIDLTAPGNLGAWFSSMLLAVGAAACMMVFNLRQHRLDDYRGRYRMWAPACIVLMLASINASCDLTGLVASVAGQHLQGHIPGDPRTWVMAAGALAIAACGVRLLIETRESRGATSTATIAGICYALLLTARLGRGTETGAQFEAFAGVDLIVLQTSAAMCGHLMVLLSIVLYSRYVLLDSQGKIQELARQRAEKREARRLAREEAAKAKKAAAAAKKQPGDPDPDPATAEPPKKKRSRSKSKAPVLPPGYEEEDAADEDVYEATGYEAPSLEDEYDFGDDEEEQQRVEVPESNATQTSGDPHKSANTDGDPSSGNRPRKMSKAERRRERKRRRAA